MRLLFERSWDENHCVCPFKEYHGNHTALKIRDVCMDFEAYFKVHSLVSVHAKSIILGQMINLNMIFHVVGSVYRLVEIWNSPWQFPAEFRNGQLHTLTNQIDIRLFLSTNQKQSQTQLLLDVRTFCRAFWRLQVFPRWLQIRAPFFEFWLVECVRYDCCDCSVVITLIYAGFSFVWQVLYTKNNVECFCKDSLSLNLALPLSDKTGKNTIYLYTRNALHRKTLMLKGTAIDMTINEK